MSLGNTRLLLKLQIIVWDIEKGEAVNVIDCHKEAIHSMSLNRDGSLLATTSKDKRLRIIEPRSGIVKSVSTLSLLTVSQPIRLYLAIQKLLILVQSRIVVVNILFLI